MTNLAEQPGKIAVLGLGREGLDLLRFFHQLNIKPTGLDATELLSTDVNYREIKQLTSELRTGNSYLDSLNDFAVVFRSPGVPLDLPALKKAKRRGTVFSSLTQLFFDLCPAKIVGVTGTKGKSTTAALIYHFLKGKPGSQVYFGGNIGYPPLALLPKLTKQDIVILELSSFQLEDLTKSPRIAVMLTLSPEHLDRHKTFKKYIDAKLNIVRYQNKGDFAVVSADENTALLVAKSTKGRVVKYSIRKILPRGVYLAGEEIVYRDARSGRRQVVMPVKEIQLSGQHNVSNSLAAITAALLLGATASKIRQRCQTFQSLEHRLETIGHKGKVKFVDDSLATTPIATIAAVNATPGPVTLILGGSTKKENFKDLIRSLARRDIQGVVLIGDTADKLQRLCKSAQVKFPAVKVRDFATAVKQAYRYAQPAGTVLLSPACASFGWFRDAYDRGAQFKQLVTRLISEK